MRIAHGPHVASMPNPPLSGRLRRLWHVRLGITAARRLWHCTFQRKCARAHTSRRSNQLRMPLVVPRAAPPGAPRMTCMRGLFAHRTRSAWDVGAQPYSLPPAAPAAPALACAARGHCRLAPVVLHRPAPVHMRRRCTPAVAARPPKGARVGMVMGGAGASAFRIMLPTPPPRPSRVQHTWGGGTEPGGARDAVSARDIAEKSSLMGRSSPGSAAEDATAGGKGVRGSVAALPAL